MIICVNFLIKIISKTLFSDRFNTVSFFTASARLRVSRSRILEENTYYPDGLKIAGLCAKAFNKLPNEFGYQGNYAEEEESGYDEFALRMYDPTIGRWLSTDPYDQFASPYIGMGNDPVNLVDPDGGGVLDFFGPGNPIAGVAHAAAQAAAKSLVQRGAMIAANVATNLVGSAVAKKLFPLPTLNGQSLKNLSFAIPGGAIPAGLSQSAVTLETGTLAGETIIETGVVITDGAAITETGLGFTAMLEAAGVTVAEGTVATIAGPVILVAAGVGILAYCIVAEAHDTGPPPADFYQHFWRY